MKHDVSHLLNTFVIMLMIGLTYAWSVFVTPLETSYGWNRTQTSLVLTLLLISYSVGNILTGILSRFTGYRIAAFIGSLLICAGLAGAAFAGRFGWFAFCYGIVSGTGIGMLYHTTIAVTPPWYPGRQGTATGLLVMGYALSASVLGPLCQFFLSRYSIRATLLILAALEAAVLLFCSFQLEIWPGTELSRGTDGEGQRTADKGQEQCRQSIHEMVLSNTFFCYYGIGVLWYLIGTSVMNHGPVALQGDLSLSPASAALILSAMNIVCGIMRPAIGVIHDRIGLFSTLFLGAVLFMAGCGGGCLALGIGSTVLFIAALFFVMGGLACLGTIHSIGTRQLFGEINFSRIYPVMCTNSITASFGTVLVGGLQRATGHYTLSFLVLAGFSVIPLLLILVLWKRSRKKEDRDTVSQGRDSFGYYRIESTPGGN